MQRRGLLPLLLCLVGCGSPAAAGNATTDDSNNLTEDAGPTDAGVPDAALVVVAPYVDAEIGADSKMRWSLDDGQVVEAARVDREIITAGSDRRFRLTAAPATGRPVAYVEFGRGSALVEPGVYDCASLQAVVLVILADGSKPITVIDGQGQRACKVTVDAAVETPTAGRARSVRRVLGRFEAELGPRTDGAATTNRIHGAFGSVFIE